MATQEPRRIGRPPKLTPEVQGAIITAITAGGTAKHAARIAGIHRVTLCRWLREARGPGARADLREFAEAFACACAERKRKRLTREPITDGDGREVGTRTTRHLPNGITQISERFTRPDRRALLAQARESAMTADSALEKLLLGRA